MTVYGVSEPCAPAHGGDHMRFDGHGGGRGGGGRQLRIERANDAIRAFGREGRRGVEEAEIARMRLMYDAAFQLPDGEGEAIVKRARLGEIERSELSSAALGIEQWFYGPGAQPLRRLSQLIR